MRNALDIRKVYSLFAIGGVILLDLIYQPFLFFVDYWFLIFLQKV